MKSIVLLSNFSALLFAADHGRLAFIAFSAESSQLWGNPFINGSPFTMFQLESNIGFTGNDEKLLFLEHRVTN